MRELKKIKAAQEDLASLEKMIAYLEEKLKDLGEATANNAEDLMACAVALNQKRQASILAYWRCNLSEKASSATRELLETSHLLVSTIEEFRLKPQLNKCWPDFGRYALFSYLLEGEFREELLNHCKLRGNDDIIDQQVFGIVDMNLALTISNGKKSRGYDLFLERKFRQKRKYLIADTFLAYGAIVRAVSEGKLAELDDLVRTCDENYEKRAKDIDYKNFGTEDGTARFNPYHIDFRLATVLKWAICNHRVDRNQIHSIHQWNFS